MVPAFQMCECVGFISFVRLLVKPKPETHLKACEILKLCIHLNIYLQGTRGEFFVIYTNTALEKIKGPLQNDQFVLFCFLKVNILI